MTFHISEDLSSNSGNYVYRQYKVSFLYLPRRAEVHWGNVRNQPFILDNNLLFFFIFVILFQSLQKVFIRANTS